MFSCSSTLILPFSHSHTHTLQQKKKEKKKCEAINNKAKSKTKFNKRDSKRCEPNTELVSKQTKHPFVVPLPPLPTCSTPLPAVFGHLAKYLRRFGLRMPINQSGKKVAEQCAACVEFAFAKSYACV